MRRVIVMALVLSSTILIAQTPPSQPQKSELKKAMHSFASAMALIQEGILYNQTDKMLEGVAVIKKEEEELLLKHGEILERYMPERPEFARSYAESTAKRISDYSQRLNRQITHVRDYSKIAASYTHILHECVGCHQKIRRWQ